LDRWFQDIQVRRLIAEIDRMLKEQRDLGPSTTPLYLSIVGLGRTANEFPLLVDLVDGTLDRLRGSGTKEELVAHLNLRFGIYEVMREALSSADQRHELIKMAYLWTADRIDVRFYDMTIPGFYATWSDRKLGLVLARNSLRNYIVDKGWPFILAVKNKLVPGGLFGVDDEAAAQITGMYRVLKKLPDFAADA